MEHPGYKFVREELRITSAKVERVRYMQETLVCPVCREGDETTIKAAVTPTPLLAHSPASPDMVVMVMYRKSFLHLPFYRQSKDWLQKGVPVPRETAAHWYNHCALTYLLPIYENLHQELLLREVIHADEVPCQVLHEEGRDATSRSYMWIYLSGTDGRPQIILYDYRPGIYQYLYTLLLYMPDYKDEPAGIEQLMPWSDFIKERCSGIIDTETETPENRGNLPV
jgi:transposase